MHRILTLSGKPTGRALLPRISVRTIQRILLVVIGSIICAFGYALFQVPFNLVSGGVSGIAIMVNHFTGWQVGVVNLVLNIPLMFIGYRYLGGWRFLGYTVLSVVVFSLFTDLFGSFIPLIVETPLTDDMLLSSVYAGIITGIGTGLVFRAGGTTGGTNVIVRMVQKKTGIPMGQAYMYCDGLIILAAGVFFGWELAMHGLLVMLLAGIAGDYGMEGPSTVRTATIVTNEPEELTNALMNGLIRGASHWEITGSYTGSTRSMVMCTVNRSQVADLRHIVAITDPDAFVVIGNAHQALGGGFQRLKDEEG